jgi:hypothetical protein
MAVSGIIVSLIFVTAIQDKNGQWIIAGSGICVFIAAHHHYLLPYLHDTRSSEQAFTLTIRPLTGVQCNAFCHT